MLLFLSAQSGYITSDYLYHFQEKSFKTDFSLSFFSFFFFFTINILLEASLKPNTNVFLLP